jgi:hypothetical protein
VKAAHVKLVDDKRAHVPAPQRERTDNEASDCQGADGSGPEGERTECNCSYCRHPRPSLRHYWVSEHLPRGTGLPGAGLLMSHVHLVHSFTSVCDGSCPTTNGFLTSLLFLSDTPMKIPS